MIGLSMQVHITVTAADENKKQLEKHRQIVSTCRAAPATVISTRITSNRATVTVFVTVWPWPLTFGSMHAKRLL